jgi:DNA-directed RNA polymerase beta subunit
MEQEIIKFEVQANPDETGELEEFTCDLFPVVSSKSTLHLDDEALPKVGVLLSPGMIVVGKIGKTRAFLLERKPTSLEIHGMTFQELNKRFSHLWKNSSEYMPEGVHGVVESAKLVEDGQIRKAIVEIRVQSGP